MLQECLRLICNIRLSKRDINSSWNIIDDNRPVTNSIRARIRRFKEEWNSARTIRGTFLHFLDLDLVIKY